MGEPYDWVLIMGVAGSGKTDVGRALAGKTGWPFLDADDYHPPGNIEKMSAGQALTDEDRWPWYEAISKALNQALEAKGHAILACSALKKAHRDFLLKQSKPGQLAYLKISPETVKSRMALRKGHFFPASLVDSQFQALEVPSKDVLVVDAEADLDQEVEALIGAVGLQR